MVLEYKIELSGCPSGSKWVKVVENVIFLLKFAKVIPERNGASKDNHYVYDFLH